jgi:hypothetical protein
MLRLSKKGVKFLYFFEVLHFSGFGPQLASHVYPAIVEYFI